MAAAKGNGEWIRGKTCMITGATSGLGRATAIELARLGAHTFLVCRSPERGADLVRDIERVAPQARVELMLADLSIQSQIRDVANSFLGKGVPLHALVNNAGVFNMKRELTADGIETVFAVNHLAYFMLTLMLLDRIKQSAPARIVNVASDLHKRASIDFDDLGGEKSFGGISSYGQSKLANILFTYELSRRLAGTGVTVNCVHPGGVATNLANSNGFIVRNAWKAVALFMKSPEDGASTQIYLASSPEVEGVTGKYFIDCHEARSSVESYDANIARKLWDISAKMTATS